MKSLRSKLRALLDRKFSIICRYLWPECPWHVEFVQATECFHFLHRGKESTRWHFGNAVASCWQCNRRYEDDAEFAAYVKRWYIAKFGQEKWNENERIGNRPALFSLYDLQQRNKALDLILGAMYV